MCGTVKIKMLETVKPDLAGIIPTPKIIALKGETYEAHVNTYGAVSVLIEDENEHLQMLGVKPGEFEFVHAPAWVLEKHGKLAPEYEELKLKCDRLTDDVKQLREANEILRQENNKLELDIEHTKKFWHENYYQEVERSKMQKQHMKESKEKLQEKFDILRDGWIDLCNKILSEHDKNGWCRLVVTKEAAENMMKAVDENS